MKHSYYLFFFFLCVSLMLSCKSSTDSDPDTSAFGNRLTIRNTSDYLVKAQAVRNDSVETFTRSSFIELPPSDPGVASPSGSLQINLNDDTIGGFKPGEQLHVIYYTAETENSGSSVDFRYAGSVTLSFEDLISNDRTLDISNADIHSDDAPYPCILGKADNEFLCDNISLYARLPITELVPDGESGGGVSLNDIWGWTDPSTGKEYALVGLSNGVSFVDISEPSEPVVVGVLPEAAIQAKSTLQPGDKTGCDIGLGSSPEARKITRGSTWRDLKVFDNHAFIVKDYSSLDPQPHGMQVFDLTKLRNYNGTKLSFSADAQYTGFYNAHNIVINEASGFAYATGVTDSEMCGDRRESGLHMVDINDPVNPEFAGCYIDPSPGNYRVAQGYIHDAQCVMYQGPDSEHQGKEVCFNSAEGNVVIADVSDKARPKTIGYNRALNMQYSHQGWLTANQAYFIMNDELDEINLGRTTKTYVWDVRDLDSPKFIGHYSHNSGAVDHNLYVHGNHAYASNYNHGLRVLDLTNVSSASLETVAYFDTQPNTNEAIFSGNWSNYPFFESGHIIMSDINDGLFIVKVSL